MKYFWARKRRWCSTMDRSCATRLMRALNSYLLSARQFVTRSLLVVMRTIDMTHKLSAGARVVAERATHRGGDHLGVGLLDAAHHRAHMHALGHHRHAA